MPQQEDKDKSNDVSITDRFVFVHFLLASVGIVRGFTSMFLEIEVKHLTTAVSIFCTCLLMFGIAKLMKCVMGYIHKRHNTGEMKRCRNQMLIGFGGITICGIISKIVFFYFDNFDYIHSNDYILYYCFITCLVTSVSFYYNFVYEFQKTWRVNYKKKHIPLISILLAIQITVFIVMSIATFDACKFSTEYPICKYVLVNVGFRQFCILVLSATSLIDIGVIFAGGLKKKNGMRLESVEVVQPSAPPLEFAEANSPRLECKICMEEYSESVIPRMLKECGHTICEKCAGQLLDKSNGQHLFCPFCQGVTVVKGPANQLPKNFAITNMIDEKMQMN